MSDVFLSHSAEERAAECPLAEQLRKASRKFWFHGSWPELTVSFSY